MWEITVRHLFHKYSYQSHLKVPCPFVFDCENHVLGVYLTSISSWDPASCMSTEVDILFTCIFLKYLELPYQALYHSVEDILGFPVMCHVMGLHAGNFIFSLYQDGWHTKLHILSKEERQVKYSLLIIIFSMIIINILVH